MVKQGGFTLIEFLIYLMLLMWLGFLASEFVLHTLTNVSQSNKALQAQANILLGFDCLIHEIRSVAPDTIQNMAGNYLAWHAPQGDVCWCVEKGCLVRIVGAFDTTTGQWGKKNKAILAPQVTSLQVEPIVGARRVKGVRCALCYTVHERPYEIKQTIMFRNKVLP